MAEGAPLLREYTLTRIEGSNPSLSANSRKNRFSETGFFTPEPRCFKRTGPSPFLPFAGFSFHIFEREELLRHGQLPCRTVHVRKTSKVSDIVQAGYVLRTSIYHHFLHNVVNFHNRPATKAPCRIISFSFSALLSCFIRYSSLDASLRSSAFCCHTTFKSPLPRSDFAPLPFFPWCSSSRLCRSVVIPV